MRTKILTVAAAGVLGLTGVAVAGPALAVVGADTAAATVTSRVDAIKRALSGLVSDGTLTQAQADKVATTLDSAGALHGPGGPGGPGRGGPDLGTAAGALGMTEDDLRTALQGGKTLAQVAKDKGVALDTLVQAIVGAEKARIAQDVSSGRITQQQADERLADLTTRVTDRVNAARPAGPWHGHGGPGRFGPDTPAPNAPATGAPAPAPQS